MTDTQTPPNAPSNATRANAFPWPPVLLAAGILGAWALGTFVPLAWPGLDDTAARAVGIGFGIAGALLIESGVVTLARAGTTIMPNGISEVLVTGGPYALFRNPIYLGEVLVLLFVADWTRNFWFVVMGLLFAVLVTALQIIPEERHLAAQFGDAYDAYRARSRRWI